MENSMSMKLQSCMPLVPSEAAIGKSMLPDKAIDLSVSSSRLGGRIAECTRQTIIEHMAVINSYYSNMIEGNPTKPYKIREAQKGIFSNEPAKRDLQKESLAHIQVQKWIKSQTLTLDDVFTSEFIKSVHCEFYRHVPESFLDIKNDDDEVIDKVVPGQWRERSVKVGNHIPPDATTVDDLMKEFFLSYHPNNFKGEKRIIAAMCMHHRFTWIHPFIDGNGRVGRLLTDTVLRLLGLESEGVWCLSRGLARSSTEYKESLANADAKRKGDLDGRGGLSESELVVFADFMLTTAIDQVSYMDKLLELSAVQKRITSYIRDRNSGLVEGYGKIKDSAAIVLFNAFTLGKLDRVYAKQLTGEKDTSAKRLLAQLRDEGLLSETSHRSELFWEIPEHAEKWYFPNLAS